jgi:reverse gyrase
MVFDRSFGTFTFSNTRRSRLARPKGSKAEICASEEKNNQEGRANCGEKGKFGTLVRKRSSTEVDFRSVDWPKPRRLNVFFDPPETQKSKENINQQQTLTARDALNLGDEIVGRSGEHDGQRD